MSQIERTRRATIDVTDLWVRIAKDNFSAAERLVDRFDAALEQLARNPHMGEAVDEIRQGLRRFQSATTSCIMIRYGMGFAFNA